MGNGVPSIKSEAEHRSRFHLASDVADTDPGTRTVIAKTGPRFFDRELRIRSIEVARGWAGAIGAGIVAVTIFWFLRAGEWRDPCGAVNEGFVCDQPPAWFRWSQFGLATIGLATGLVVGAYLLRFAAQSRIWNNSRKVAIAHGVVVFLWLAVWTVGTGVR